MLIDIKDLTVTVGNQEHSETNASVLLESVNLTVNAGETILITGCSGSGKSSLIGVLNGLIPHFRPATLTGLVSVEGTVPAEVDLAEAGRMSATVFQNPRTQFFATDVLSEVAFAASNQGVAHTEMLKRVDQAASLLGITGLLGRRMHELSGGELQRVALASAIVTRPKLYLLDEPTANLDDASTDAVADSLERLRSTGATIVIAEHRLHYLKGLVDRVVELDNGHTVRDWTATEFWDRDPRELQEAGMRSLTAPDPTPLPSPSTSPSASSGEQRHGLQLHNLSVSRGGRKLWTIPDVTLPRGEVTCVTGRNGVGKSTLLRVIVGLQRASGTLLLDGETLSVKDRRKRCAAVMQDVNRQLFGMSVADEMSLGRYAPDSVTARELLAEMGLDGTEERHPLSLSGGQRQRLAVATAAGGADVVVFDEPTSGLDLRSMTEMAGVIRRCANRGAVVALVTHDRELVNLVGDYEFELQ